MSTFDASTPQLKTVKNLMDAFASFNLDKFAALLSKNFQYEAFGGVTDLAKMDTEAYAEVIQGLYVGVTKTDFTYHEVIEAPGKVIIHLSALFNTASGTTLPYDAVGIVSIEEEDGELKVLSLKSFPDVQKHNAAVAATAKAVAERRSAS